MQKVSFQLKNEFLWLLAAAVLTIMIAYNRFGNSITDDTLDLHLHDTFFVISRWMVMIPLFLLVTFWVFFIKTRISKTSTDFSYLVFILSGLGLGISIGIETARTKQLILKLLPLKYAMRMIQAGTLEPVFKSKQNRLT